MSYLVLGALFLAFLVYIVRPSPVLRRAGTRILSSTVSIGLFAIAAYVGIRGAWGKAMVLVLLGAGLALSARMPAQAQPRTTDQGRMSLKEARDMLGLGVEASPAEIRQAHRRLMQHAHPDRGGTTGLAAQLNAARDRLLKP
jgi:hypothetical protein